MMSSLKRIWGRWLVVSEIIGDIVSIIVLTIAYITIFFIPCLFFTFISDKMGKHYQPGSYLQDMVESGAAETLEEM